MSIETGTKRKKSLQEIRDHISGGEPKFAEGKELSKIEIIQCLNWYSVNCDDKEYEKFIPGYLKKRNVSSDKIKKIVSCMKKHSSFQTLSVICRMIDRGAIFSKKDLNWVDETVKKIEQLYVPEKEENKFIVNIQDRINETVSICIGELEGILDDYISVKYSHHYSAAALFQEKNIKSVHANRIMEWVKKRRKEFSDAISSKDEYVIESFSNFKKTHLKKIVAYWDSVITDCSAILNESKANRKPRKQKRKTPEQMVSKLNYCKKDKIYSFESIDPTKIIGSLQLWVFNVKTRKVGVYNAQDAAGLMVKGSTLLNFDEQTSVSKTLRKPGESIAELMKGGKSFLKTFLGKINSKESVLTGRINSDTVLLRTT